MILMTGYFCTTYNDIFKDKNVIIERVNNFEYLSYNPNFGRVYVCICLVCLLVSIVVFDHDSL